MDGREVKLQPSQNPTRFGGFKGFIERGSDMDIQVVQHQANLQCLRKMHIHQRFHLQGEVAFGAPLGDRDVPPALTRAESDEQIGRAFTPVVIVIAAALPRQQQEWVGGLRSPVARDIRQNRPPGQ